MYSIKKTTLLAISIIIFTACTGEEQNKHEQKITLEKMHSPEYMSYANAINMAKESKKTVLIKLTAEHCRYCQKMDKEVLADDDVLKSLEKDFLSVEIDVDKNEIPLNINRSMTPTFVFVSKDEKIISKVPGSWGKKDFLDILNFVRKKTKGVQS